MKWNALVAVCVVLVSSAVVAQSRSDTPVADHVSEEAATLRIRVADAIAPVPITVHFGMHDGGQQANIWEYHVPLGEREHGVVAAPIEGLKAGTRYFVRFELGSPPNESWSDVASFTTRTATDLTAARSKNIPRAQIPQRGFVSTRPATRWEEGLLTGNGKMGAVVLSRPLDEKILLTHERLFLPLRKSLPPFHMKAVLPAVQEAIAKGQYARSTEIMMEQATKDGHEPGMWTGAFLPAADLVLHMEPRGAIRDYYRSEDFATGVTSVHWTDDRGSFNRRTFASRADNAMVLSFEADRPHALSFDVRLAQRALEKVDSWGVQGNVARGVKLVKTSAFGDTLMYSSVLSNGASYDVFARVIPTGGHVSAESETLHIADADSVLILLYVEPVSTPAKMQKQLTALPSSFDALLARHAKIHGAIFNRVSLDLNGGDDRYLPIELLQAKSTIEHPNAALLEKIFDAGRYTILSATGDWPPNLQGKWNGTWGPAWAGGYTLDGNLETAIASELNGNMPELMLSFFGFVERMLPEFRANAQKMYGARGILVPVQIATSGYHNQTSKQYPLAFWTAGAGWVAHYYFDYYLYTGDKKFLRERALPFMKEAALFYEDFLQEGADGKYVFNPSYSPENTPRNSNSPATINATMDVAVAHELFRNLIATCETLKIEQESVTRWKRILAKLPQYQVNNDGALKEWTWPTLEDQYAHRHLSHLYPLYFAVPSEIARDPTLLTAFRVAADRRMQWRGNKGGGEMAFGMIQLGEVATSLGDGDAALNVVSKLAQRNYYNNLMTSHDPGPSIFNADVSGGLPDVVIRMLVQSQPGTLQLLPALPSRLPTGEIRGVLAQSQIEITRLKWSPGRCAVVLHSTLQQTITVITPRDITSVQGSPTHITQTGSRTFQVFLPENENVEVSIGMN